MPLTDEVVALAVAQAAQDRALLRQLEARDGPMPVRKPEPFKRRINLAIRPKRKKGRR